MMRSIFSFIYNILSRIKWYVLCKGNYPNIKVMGLPYFRVMGTLKTQSKLIIQSGMIWNPIGGIKRTVIVVEKSGLLSFGKNVQLSNTNIYCRKEIIIGDYTMIGNGVSIWDTDFHSVSAKLRMTDQDKGVSKKIEIGKNVFIGANTIILKGVNIGEGAVIGAGSVVSKDVGCNEIWAGNPCKYLKDVVD